MNEVHLVDYLFAALGSLLTIGWIVLFYALRKNAESVKETAALVLSEKEKTAALVLSESRLTAQLVLSEREKLAAQVKQDHILMQEELTSFRIKVAEDYATTKMVKEVLQPIIKEFEDIKVLLNSKLDRREFERHEARQNGQHNQ